MAQSPFALLVNATTDTPGAAVDLDGVFRRVQLTVKSSSNFVPNATYGYTAVELQWSESQSGPFEALTTLSLNSASKQMTARGLDGFYRFVRAAISPGQAPAAGSVSANLYFD